MKWINQQRHILPVFPSAKFSQKISGQIMPQVKNAPGQNAPGQKCLRSKMPLVKKCPGSKTSHFKKWPCELNRENTCLYKTPQRLTWNRISDWLYDPGQTSTNVMSFLCHFQQFYASRRQVPITGFLTKWFTGLDSPIPVLFPVDIDYLSINKIKSGS